MTTDHLVFLSVPGLRPRDIDRSQTPTLYDWANSGGMFEMRPTFPCVTSPVQASMLTGRPPSEHGVIANGFYHRDREEIEFWVAHNSVIEHGQTWDFLRRSRSEFTSAAWHMQNVKGAGADFVVTPSPIHEPDGSMKLWCYSKPEGTYQALLAELGHFPLQHYWGPLSNIESTRWILKGAKWLIDRHRPNFHWIYIPHLDYASQKYGPNSPQARNSLSELDLLLAEFSAYVAESAIGHDALFLVAGEYALTEVSSVLYPNRLLREAGLVATREDHGAEQIDLGGSRAFAMVDHQFAHIYVRDEHEVEKCASFFETVPGIEAVFFGSQRAEVGLAHERSGEIILICDPAHWFAYYWWLDDDCAPPFARTVDIHAKPGYDPVELFVDPATRGISLDASLVKGSHGVPASGPDHRTALICSKPAEPLDRRNDYRDVDINGLCLALLGV